jgi:hypothetical protein
LKAQNIIVLAFICVTSGVSYFPHFHTMMTQKNLEVSDFSVHLLTRFADFLTCVVTSTDLTKLEKNPAGHWLCWSCLPQQGRILCLDSL